MSGRLAGVTPPSRPRRARGAAGGGGRRPTSPGGAGVPAPTPDERARAQLARPRIIESERDHAVRSEPGLYPVRSTGRCRRITGKAGARWRAGRTSRFSQTLSTGPLRGHAASRPGLASDALGVCAAGDRPEWVEVGQDALSELVARVREGERGVSVQALQALGRGRATDPELERGSVVTAGLACGEHAAHGALHLS